MELRLPNKEGRLEPYDRATEGGVQLNEAEKTLTIGLGVNQSGRIYRLGINGTYDYRESR